MSAVESLRIDAVQLPHTLERLSSGVGTGGELKKRNPELREILGLSGGGARNDLWYRVESDMMDRPIHRLANIDTAAFGAALIAGVGTGVYTDFATAGGAAVKVEQELLPNRAMRSYYEELFAQF